MEGKPETITQIIRELHQQIEKTLERLDAMGNTNTADETVPNQMRTTLTSAKRVVELHQPSKSEKTPHIIEETVTLRENFRKAREIAQHLHELRNSYVMLERRLFLLRLKAEKDKEEIPNFESLVESMEIKVKNIEGLRTQAAELKAERKNLPFWKRRRRREIDKELELVEADLYVALHSFNSKYHIPYGEASFEIDCIRKKIVFKQTELDKLNARIDDGTKELDAIEIEYRNQRQIADNHPDRVLIDNLLEQMRETPASARDSLRRMQLERHLDAIADGKIR